MDKDFFSVPQLIGYFALIIYVTAYFFKDDNRLKITFSISNIFWVIHYFLLGAQTAAAVTAIITVRNLLSLNASHLSANRKKVSVWVFTALLLIAGALTWAGWVSLIPVTATISVTYAMFYLQGEKLRRLFLLIDVAWLVHALIVDSYSGLIYAIGAIVANLYTIFKISRKRKTII